MKHVLSAAKCSIPVLPAHSGYGCCESHRMWCWCHFSAPLPFLLFPWPFTECHKVLSLNMGFKLHVLFKSLFLEYIMISCYFSADIFYVTIYFFFLTILLCLNLFTNILRISIIQNLIKY